jgi:hypothetical protein
MKTGDLSKFCRWGFGAKKAGDLGISYPPPHADLCFVGQIFATPHSPRVFIGLNAQETMALFHKPTQEKVF